MASIDTTTEPTAATASERPLRADARRNRDKIVQAAREIVAAQGTAAQIDDVAHKAGVGVGTVYRHFPNKDALMAALLRECFGEHIELMRTYAEVEDPWEAFAGMVRGVCEAMAVDAAKRRMWTAASDEAFEMAADTKAEMTGLMEAIVERGQAAGEIRPDLVLEDIAMMFCGLSAPMEMRGDFDYSRLVEFALDGLRAR